MTNYMPEIAKMLGVELGEIFEIQIDEYKTFQFRFTENGLQCFNGKMWDGGTIAIACLNLLLVGKYVIKRKPWKPNLDDEYYYVDECGYVCSDPWVNSVLDFVFYKIGNCYKTKEEAEKNKDQWIAFYASDEVLEV